MHYGLILYLINKKYAWHKGISIGLVVLLIVASIAFAGINFSVGENFKVEVEGAEKEQIVPLTSDSTVLELSTQSIGNNEFRYRGHGHGMNKIGDLEAFYIDQNKNLVYQEGGDVGVEVELSADGKVHLISRPTAYGKNGADALKNTESLLYQNKIDTNRVVFDLQYRIPNPKKWRDQSVSYTLQIPLGQKIKVGDDIDIETQIFGYDFNERPYTLIMTNKGLVCLDCKDRYNDDERGFDEEEKGIYLGKGNEKIIINDSGVKIYSGKDSLKIKK